LKQPEIARIFCSCADQTTAMAASPSPPPGRLESLALSPGAGLSPFGASTNIVETTFYSGISRLVITPRPPARGQLQARPQQVVELTLVGFASPNVKLMIFHLKRASWVARNLWFTTLSRIGIEGIRAFRLPATWHSRTLAAICDNPVFCYSDGSRACLYKAILR